MNSQNLATVKRTEQMKLDGIIVDAEWRDGSLFAVTLTDKSGALLKIAKSNYGDMSAYTLAPPKKVKQFVVTGEFGSGAAKTAPESFDDKFEADNRASELRIIGADVNIAEAEVEVPF